MALGRDWREQVLVTCGRILALVAAVPVTIGILADSFTFVRFVPHLVLLVAGSAWAGWSRTLRAGARATLIGVPLVVVGAFSAYRLGPTAGVGLILAMVTLLFALVRGARVGIAALLLTAAVLVGLGWAGRASSGVYLLLHHARPPYWVRTLVLYLGTTGLMLVLVTRAIRRVEQHERRLRLALRAAASATFSCDVRTRSLSWDPHGATPRALPVEVLPRSVDEALSAWVHADDRARVAAALDDALAGRADFELEHRMVLPGGEVIWIEARGSVHQGVLMGTVWS